MTAAIETGVWLPSAVGLALGAAAVVALAALAAWRVRSGPWRRTIWQAAVAAMLLLVAMEATGVGPGAAAWLLARARTEPCHGRSCPAVQSGDASSPGRGFITPSPWMGEGRLVLRSEAMLRRVAGEGEIAEGDKPQATSNINTRVARPVCPAGRAHLPVGQANRATQSDFPRRVSLPPAESVSERSFASTTDGSVPPWLPALVWALGAAVVAGRAATARVLLARLRRRREPDDAALRRRVCAVAERVGLRRRVRLVESASLAAPLAFGVLRPTVVLPHGFADDLDGPAQEAVLAHELAHLAAGDPAWLLAADAVTVLLWWHPLVWMARRRLASACESAADEASLLVDDGPRRLAACLLRWGRRLRGRGAMAHLGVGGEYRSGLGRRLVRLVALRSQAPRSGGRRHRRLVRTAGPILLVTLAMLMTGWARPEPPEKGDETMGILHTAWTKSIAGTIVLAALAGGPDAAVADERGEGREEVRLVERDREGGQERREGEGERRKEGERREGEGERRKEGERREGEGERRKEGERREGEGERRKEGERREGEGERRKEGERREGEGERRKEGERREGEGERREGDWRNVDGHWVRVERREEGEEGERRRDGERREREAEHGGREWQEAVDRSLKRLSALRLLKRLVAMHGKRDHVQLVEQLLNEEQERYERLLKARRDREREGEGERREGERDRERAREGEEREVRRERDREGEGERRREGERREGERDRERAREGEGERRREGERREGEGERREGERREGEGERREVRRERDREGEGERRREGERREGEGERRER